MFYQTLKSTRMHAYLTMRALSVQLGIPENTYQNWERKRCLPSPERMKLLLQRFPDQAEELEREYMEVKLRDPREEFRKMLKAAMDQLEEASRAE